MLLFDKSIGFIERKHAFYRSKVMLLSAEKRKNRPVLSIPFTYFPQLSPQATYLIAAGDSRWGLNDDGFQMRKI